MGICLHWYVGKCYYMGFVIPLPNIQCDISGKRFKLKRDIHIAMWDDYYIPCDRIDGSHWVTDDYVLVPEGTVLVGKSAMEKIVVSIDVGQRTDFYFTFETPQGHLINLTKLVKMTRDRKIVPKRVVDADSILDTWLLVKRN